MSDETKISVGSDTGEGLAITVGDDRIFITGLWKNRTSKSKKGNMNMSWHNRALFDEAIAEYRKIGNTFHGRRETEPGPDEGDPF